MSDAIRIVREYDYSYLVTVATVDSFDEAIATFDALRFVEPSARFIILFPGE